MTQTNRSYWYNKTKDLLLTDLAKLMREEIKAGVKAGEIPQGIKTSVHVRNGHAIDITIKAVPEGFGLVSKLPEHHPDFKFNPFTRSEQLTKVLTVLEEIRDRYNYDESDITTDLFLVRYYGAAQPDWRMMSSAEKVFAATGVA